MIESLFKPFSPDNTELMLAVAASRYGNALDEQIRYEQYCSLPEDTKHRFLPPEIRKEFRDLWSEDWLDADVNNLQHNVFTAYLGLVACEIDGVDSHATGRVTRALLVHDLKEYVFDPMLDEGDITYDEAQARGASGFAQEHRELSTVLTDDCFDMLSQEDIADIESILNDSKQAYPETVTGQMVEIAERTGYVHTALLANAVASGEVNVQAQPSDEQVQRLNWLAENVLANHISKLVELSESHPSVALFLSLRFYKITEALDRLSDETIQRNIRKFYEQKGADINERQKKWQTTLETWEWVYENCQFLGEDL